MAHWTADCSAVCDGLKGSAFFDMPLDTDRCQYTIWYEEATWFRTKEYLRATELAKHFIKEGYACNDTLKSVSTDCVDFKATYFTLPK